jgi:hemolysin activation/secretion protein
VGGSETVRGYAEDRLWGNAAVWERLEFSLGVQGKSRFLLFYDLGIVDTVGDRQDGIVLQGFGPGIRVSSRLGIMTFDYAMTPDFGPLEGRIHTGWTQGF